MSILSYCCNVEELYVESMYSGQAFVYKYIEIEKNPGVVFYTQFTDFNRSNEPFTYIIYRTVSRAQINGCAFILDFLLIPLNKRVWKRQEGNTLSFCYEERSVK